MAKKRDARRDSGTAKPKQLRKRLRKAEDQLQHAVTKRDRAQARVDALSIIADEIRAQLAEVEPAEGGAKAKPAKARSKSKASQADAVPAESDEAKPTKAVTGRTTRKPAAAAKAAAASRPAAARKTTTAKTRTAKPAAAKPAAKRSAAAAPKSDTATTRRKPSTRKATE